MTAKATARRTTRRGIIRALEPWLYASPAILLIAGILLVPLGIGLSYAFRDLQ
jgi:multiple sugar transport system permease protein